MEGFLVKIPELNGLFEGQYWADLEYAILLPILQDYIQSFLRVEEGLLLCLVEQCVLLIVVIRYRLVQARD